VKHKQKLLIPAREEERTVRVTCDLCGCEIRKPPDFEVSDIEVLFRWGTCYPEAGWGEEFNIDLCPCCFRDRLVPWLRDQGATVEEKSWEW
jgi:hypothetical protein